MGIVAIVATGGLAVAAIRSGKGAVLRIASIPIVAGVSAILAYNAGSYWLTSAFYYFSPVHRPNPAALTLVLIGHALVIATVSAKQSRLFGLNFAAGMSMLTLAAMPLNVLMALFDNWGGSDRSQAANYLMLFVVAQVGLFVASIIGVVSDKRIDRPSVIVSTALWAALVWGGSFPLTHWLLA